jgi:membrane protein implicated in regulation of membrane protease activity
MGQLLSDIFLGCFLAGFVLTAASLMFGADHGGGDAGSDFSADISPDFDAGVDVGHGHGHGHGWKFGLSWLSFNSLVMFLTFFGAVGFALLSTNVAPLLALFLAVLAGIGGGLVVALFVRKFLVKGNTEMRSADYQMAGTLGRITSSIREGGTGEIVYVQGGTRKTLGARSDEGVAHPLGQEVVIVDYKSGIAYVRAIRPGEFEPGEEGAPVATES